MFIITWETQYNAGQLKEIQLLMFPEGLSVKSIVQTIY